MKTILKINIHNSTSNKSVQNTFFKQRYFKNFVLICVVGYNAEKNLRVIIVTNVKPFGKSLTPANQRPRWSWLMKRKVY